MGSPLDLVQVMLGSGTPRAWQMILVPAVKLSSVSATNNTIISDILPVVLLKST